MKLQELPLGAVCCQVNCDELRKPVLNSDGSQNPFCPRHVDFTVYRKIGCSKERYCHNGLRYSYCDSHLCPELKCDGEKVNGVECEKHRQWRTKMIANAKKVITEEKGKEAEDGSREDNLCRQAGCFKFRNFENSSANTINTQNLDTENYCRQHTYTTKCQNPECNHDRYLQDNIRYTYCKGHLCVMVNCNEPRADNAKCVMHIEEQERALQSNKEKKDHKEQGKEQEKEVNSSTLCRHINCSQSVTSGSNFDGAQNIYCPKHSKNSSCLRSDCCNSLYYQEGLRYSFCKYHLCCEDKCDNMNCNYDHRCETHHSNPSTQMKFPVDNAEDVRRKTFSKNKTNNNSKNKDNNNKDNNSGKTLNNEKEINVSAVCEKCRSELNSAEKLAPIALHEHQTELIRDIFVRVRNCPCNKPL